MSENKPIQYEDKFVIAPGGSKDFGEIKTETGLTGGRIRLPKGEQDEITGKGFGEIHIERPHRLKQLQQNGYKTARDVVADVSRNYDAIHQAGIAGIYLSAPLDPKKKKIIVVKLIQDESGEYYNVITAWIGRENYLKNKPLLWSKPKSNGLKGEETAHYSQQANPAPLSAIMGNPYTLFSHENTEKSSGNVKISPENS